MPLHTFLYQGHIFTSPTRSEFALQGTPPPEDSPTATPTLSDSWERCGWGKRWYPELAFYPTSSTPSGSLFRTLRFYPKAEIPLEQQSLRHLTVYRCAHAEQWARIESLLFRVRQILEPHANILVGTDVVEIAGPSTESYTAWNSNPAAVRHRAFYARRKFLYNVAIISFMIACLSVRHGEEHAWYTLLLESGLDAHLADELSSSCLSDFSRSNPRAGVFLDPSCLWPQSWLLALIHADVPVFLDWGPAGSLKPPVNTHLSRLYPSLAQVEHALAHPLHVLSGMSPSSFPWRLKEGSDWLAGPFASQMLDRIVLSPLKAPPKRLYTWKGLDVYEGEAPPDPPRCVDNETPGQFFTRRAAYRQHFIEHIESLRQKAGRTQRENDARRYLMDERGHDEIFEWHFNVETMSWRRFSVPREDWLAVWGQRDRSTKRYDSVASEWDLAPFLDIDQHGSDDPFFRDEDYRLNPAAPDSLRTDTSESDDLGTGTSFDSLPDAAEPNSRTASATHTELEDGEVPFMPTVYVGERQEVPNVIDLIDLARTRHAFTWEPIQASTSQHAQNLPAAEACRAFGYYVPFHGSDAVLENNPQASSFITWVTSMSRASKSDSPPLPTVTCEWLLHPREHQTLANELQSSEIRIFRMRRSRRDDQAAMWGLANKETRWLSCKPVIAVEDPTTVLAVVRSFKRLNDDVIRWLSGSGIAFHFMFRARAVSTFGGDEGDPRLPLPKIRLISRPISHVFTADDYRSYEEARNHLLRSCRRVMRAALLSGGILWRLAIEAVIPDIALEEPDYNASARGIGAAQYFRDHDREPYVDDDLTRDEIRILIGMYVVSHRDRENPTNSAFPMWWPEPLRFNQSSLDYGCWTPVDEHWYRKLREQYCNGEAQPKLGVAWRSSLRNYDKRSRVLMSRSRREARSFLDFFLDSKLPK